MRKLILFLVFLAAASFVQAHETPIDNPLEPEAIATLYLHNGESIEGRFVSVERDTITIESNKGYGVLTVPKKDILLITFPESQIKLNRRYGLGYLTKTNIINVFQNTLNYNLNQLSFRTHVTEDVMFQFLAGYGSLNVKTQDPNSSASNPEYINTKYNVFTASVRVALVAARSTNSFIYGGASGGAIQLQDDAQEINETGTIISVFIGSELFFTPLPNFGFSGEISFDYQSTPTVTRAELNVGPIPIFSVHYYF